MAGATIGGLTSVVASLWAQRIQARAQWIALDKIHRQDLYREFIEQASKCYIDALQHDEVDIASLVNFYAKLGRMRILSSTRVIPTAENIGRRILDTYLQQNKTYPELMEMVNSNSIDVLGDFSVACRKEFESLRAQQF